MKKTLLNKTYTVYLDGIEQSRYESLNMAKTLYFWLVSKNPDKEVKIEKTQTEIIEI